MSFRDSELEILKKLADSEKNKFVSDIYEYSIDREKGVFFKKPLDGDSEPVRCGFISKDGLVSLGGRKKFHRQGFSISEQNLLTLRRWSEDTGLSMSGLIECLIEEYFWGDSPESYRYR